ncbi:MAG: hypothetical protein A3G24_11855 [Betaproteobacteria bacterium RIFCSPLOWO2_12_FULL_62_13]|nr:MAG: hypothetical protein A3G24_11855 [Betaproteobacteria bacterium RIFCSPLOWO2_12_FULL_62_13]
MRWRSWQRSPLRELLILAIHLLVTFAKLLRPGGVRAVAAECLLLKHQLLISNRSRQRASNLTAFDRFLIGLTTLFLSPRRIPKLGALIKPATPFKFHKALVDRKYRLLFSSSSPRRKPGPKGPSMELIAAIVEMKRSAARRPYSHAYRGRRMCGITGMVDTRALSERVRSDLVWSSPWRFTHKKRIEQQVRPLPRPDSGTLRKNL